MTKALIRFLPGIICSLILTTTVAAHHGWGGYVERVAGKFVVTGIKLGNPHDRLIATDEQGQEWNLLLAPPARNRRFGFNENSVGIGDVIEILGQRRANRLEMKVHCINMNGKNIYTYRYDNGRTSLERQRKGESC